MERMPRLRNAFLLRATLALAAVLAFGWLWAVATAGAVGRSACEAPVADLRAACR